MLVTAVTPTPHGEGKMALELAVVPIGAFDDDAVFAVLGLGAGHVPLYLVPVGAPQRAGAEWRLCST